MEKSNLVRMGLKVTSQSFQDRLYFPEQQQSILTVPRVPISVGVFTSVGDLMGVVLGSLTIWDL